MDQDRRPKKTTSLLMLDIDHFKSINDNYGHPAGDKVLAAAARRIKTAVRERDFVGRLGGEEFAVFLPQCSRRQAIEIAERIRSSIEENPILLDDGRRISITISIGATSDSASRTSLEQLLSSADQALYGAKSEGRNRVLFSAPALVE
nr:GGDEF domain-containing protein [Hyphomicrobium methylovorum]